ncbi:hypothetical protein ACSBR2_023524 [Camellia fascicularis]
MPSKTQKPSQTTGKSLVKASVDKMFQTASREEVDKKIARCIYGNGIAFNVVRSPLWADMVSSILNAPKGYKSPNYEKVRTALLDKEQKKVQQSLTPLMQDWSTHGAIDYVGPSNVVQVVTDNVFNYKAVGAII